MKCLNSKVNKIWEKVKIGGEIKGWFVWPPPVINRKRFFLLIKAEITFTNDKPKIEYFYELYEINRDREPYNNEEHPWNPFLFYKEIPEIKNMKIGIKDRDSLNLYNPYTGGLNG